MKNEMRELLTVIATAEHDDKGWVASRLLKEFPYWRRKQAEDKGFIEGFGNSWQRKYRLTDEGKMAMVNGVGITTRRVTVSPAAKEKLIEQHGLSEGDFEPMEHINDFVPTDEIKVVANGESAVTHPQKVTASAAFSRIVEVTQPMTENIKKTINAQLNFQMRQAMTAHDGGFIETHGMIAPPTEKNITPYMEACVQAIDILSEDFPEVVDLVEALMKIKARKAQSHE